jgi:hypothetical protein
MKDFILISLLFSLKKENENIYLPPNYTEKTYCILGVDEFIALPNNNKKISKLIVSFSFIQILFT